MQLSSCHTSGNQAPQCLTGKRKLTYRSKADQVLMLLSSYSRFMRATCSLACTDLMQPYGCTVREIEEEKLVLECFQILEYIMKNIANP